MADPQVKELFFAIGMWAGSQGAIRINELPGCWEGDFTFEDMPVEISVNGHSDGPRKSRGGMDVEPFHALLMINGWPAVLCSPYDGVITSGDPGVEDRLIAAFRAATPEPTNG